MKDYLKSKIIPTYKKMAENNLAENFEKLEIIDYSKIGPDKIWKEVKTSINIENFEKLPYDSPLIPNKVIKYIIF